MKDLFDEAITDELLDRFERFMERWIPRLAIAAIALALVWIIIPGLWLIARGG